MPNGKISFIIELENGQYINATNQVINATKKIENQTGNSYKKMSSEIGKHNNVVLETEKRLRRMFGIGALVGAAVLALRSFFGEIIKSSKVLQGFKTAIETGFKIGLNEEINKFEGKLGDTNKKSLELSYTVYRLTTFFGKLIDIPQFISRAIVNSFQYLGFQLEKLFNNIKIGIINLNNLIPGSDKTKNNLNINELVNKNNFINNKITNLQKKSANDLANTIKDIMSPGMSLEEYTKKYNAELNKSLGLLEKLKKANDEFNNSVSALANLLGNQFGSNDEAVKFLNTLRSAALEMEKIGNSIDVAGGDMSKLNLSTGTILDIFVSIYNVLNNIVTTIIKSVNENKNAKNTLEEINKQAEKYEGIISNIELQLRKINAELRKQTLIENDSIDAINDEIKALEDKIKAEKDSIKAKQDAANWAKSIDAEDLNRKKSILETMKKQKEDEVDFFKNNIVGQAANLLAFGAPLANAQSQLNSLNDQLNLVNETIKKRQDALEKEAQISEEETNIFEDQLAIKKLISERDKLIANQTLETSSIEERLLNAKLDGSKSDKESSKYIDELINNINTEIEAYKSLVNLSDNINEKLGYEADIQEHLNQISDLRAKKEELITNQIQKQVDLMKKYVDLGLDLENIRTVKQITKNFVSQGYTGMQLGGALQDLGVRSSVIGGKVLNIYGDINNTLNQGTGNMLINQMNNLINSIGGI